MPTLERVPEATTQWGARVVAALVLLVAVQQAVWSLLLRIGVPLPVVRFVRFTKEGLLAVVVVLALGMLLDQRRRRQLDRLDLAVAAWVVVATGYLVVGAVAGETLFPTTTDDVWLQLVSYRALVVGPVLLVAVRSFSFTGRWRRLVADAIVWASVVLAVVAVFETIFPGGMEWVAANVLDYGGYRETVFDLELPFGLVVQTSFGDAILVTRSGSLLFDYLQLGFFLLPAYAIALVRVARAGSARDRWRQVGLLALLGVGILSTATRSAILAAGVATLVVVLTHPHEQQRRLLQRFAAGGFAIVVLVSIPSGIGARMVAGLLATDASTSDHLQALRLGVETLAANPLGIGVGSTAEVGLRTDAVALIVENAYLDIGVQTGILGMLLFLAMLGLLARWLWVRRATDDLAVPALATVAGLAVGSLLLHVWLMIEAAWVAYVLAGLALPRREAA